MYYLKEAYQITIEPRLKTLFPFVVGKFGDIRNRNSETFTRKSTNCSGITSIKTILAFNTIHIETKNRCTLEYSENVVLDS